MSRHPAHDLDRLRERLRLEGTLTTHSALHIGGGGADSEAIDMPVRKTALGYPMIPGSSLKGVLRSTVETLIRGADRPALSACALFDKADHCGDAAERDAPPEPHCSVCRLFGSTRVASHVRVTDAHLTKEHGHPPIEKRDGVAIDRDLRVASDKRKYDFEVVSPGTDFAIEIFVTNPEPWMMGLLVTALDWINEGFVGLGGFTSRGLGRVGIRFTSLTRAVAARILSGQPVEVLDVAPQFHAWREALASYASIGTDGSPDAKGGAC